MLNRLFVTSFSKEGFEQYGKRFIEGFIEKFPPEDRLAVFHEGPENRLPIDNPRVWQFDLFKDKQLVDFLNRHANNPVANGIVEMIDNEEKKLFLNYRFQATKFVRKVAAITSPFLPSANWLVWIDADVVVHHTIDKEFFNNFLKDGDVFYIGRDPSEWPHSECGFVAYHTENAAVKDFLSDFRKAYVTDEVFTHQETHDSFIFDEIRRHYEKNNPAVKFVNFASHLKEFHPWNNTVLGQYMEHLKGPIAKNNAPITIKPNAPIQQTPKLPVGSAPKNIEIKTQNCVPDDNIQKNVRYAASFVDIKLAVARLTDKFTKGELTYEQYVEEITAVQGKLIRIIPRVCKENDITAIIIGGGQSVTDSNSPEYHNLWVDIKKLSKSKDTQIFAVKTSYDKCIEHGVIPYGCFLLDPREHVVKAIKNPHKDTLYIIASMCHPSTWDKFAGEGYKVVGYHAAVMAGEDKIIAEFFKKSPYMISGGTTAGFRGLSVLHAIGYRKFTTFGLDSSYYEKPKEVHGINKDKPSFNAEVHGKTFWTDPELLAQSKDMEAFTKIHSQLKMDYRGNGMLQHAYSILLKHFKEHPEDRAKIEPSMAMYIAYYKGNDEGGEVLHLPGLIKALQDRYDSLNRGMQLQQTFDEFLASK